MNTRTYKIKIKHCFFFLLFECNKCNLNHPKFYVQKVKASYAYFTRIRYQQINQIKNIMKMGNESYYKVKLSISFYQIGTLKLNENKIQKNYY